MIDLHHTDDMIEYVSAANLEDQLANQLPAGGPALVFELHPPRPDWPTA
ncbi:hypothetical protein [Oerskovia sp. Root22]|nr:hypothetical protein [Oerskovia sp. Root22]